MDNEDKPVLAECLNDHEVEFLSLALIFEDNQSQECIYFTKNKVYKNEDNFIQKRKLITGI